VKNISSSARDDDVDKMPASVAGQEQEQFKEETDVGLRLSLTPVEFKSFDQSSSSSTTST
jgi:hypothetical protein